MSETMTLEDRLLEAFKEFLVQSGAVERQPGDQKPNCYSFTQNKYPSKVAIDILHPGDLDQVCGQLAVSTKSGVTLVLTARTAL